eukprot:scaffold155_cov347-Pavlova_lutheri.AAC.105
MLTTHVRLAGNLLVRLICQQWGSNPRALYVQGISPTRSPGDCERIMGIKVQFWDLTQFYTVTKSPTGAGFVQHPSNPAMSLKRRTSDRKFERKTGYVNHTSAQLRFA